MLASLDPFQGDQGSRQGFERRGNASKIRFGISEVRNICSILVRHTTVQPISVQKDKISLGRRGQVMYVSTSL